MCADPGVTETGDANGAELESGSNRIKVSPELSLITLRITKEES